MSVCKSEMCDMKKCVCVCVCAVAHVLRSKKAGAIVNTQCIKALATCVWRGVYLPSRLTAQIVRHSFIITQSVFRSRDLQVFWREWMGLPF